MSRMSTGVGRRMAAMFSSRVWRSRLRIVCGRRVGRMALVLMMVLWVLVFWIRAWLWRNRAGRVSLMIRRVRRGCGV